MSVYADVNFIMPLILELGLICGLNMGVILSNFKKWLAGDRIIGIFPSWKGTRKPFRWFFGWSISKFTVDLIVLLAYIFIITEKYGNVMIALAPAVWIGLLLTEMLFYVIVENIIVAVMRRRTKKDSKTNKNIK